MTNPILSFVLAFSIVFHPLLAFANPKRPSSPHNKALAELESANTKSRCEKVLRVGDLDLSQKLIDAVYKYVESPKNRTSGKVVEAVKSVFRWLSLPIRAITTIPISKAVNYVRGDSKKPDESMFRIYRKKIITENGEKKELVAFVVGLPHTMKRYNRDKLDELASHFNKFGVPLMDPRVERKEFSYNFLREEYSIPQALMVWSNIGFMKLWNFVTKSSARWFIVNSTFKQFYSYPLYEDMKNLRIKSTNEDGDTVDEKVRMEARAGQVVYLLNKHRPNIVENLDRLGSDARAAIVMILMFSAINDVINTLDMGINDFSFWTTKLPIIALVSSRMIAGFLNWLQDEKIPQLSVKNFYLILKKLKHVFMSKVLYFMEKEKNNPSSSPEELFERYKYNIEHDDYWPRAFTAFFGHEPPNRDGAVVDRIESISKSIISEAFIDSQELERKRKALNVLLEGFDLEEQLNEQPLDGIRISLDLAEVPHEGKAKKTVEHGINSDLTHFSTTDEPIFFMLPQEFMKGIHDNLEENGFDHVLSARKPVEEETSPQNGESDSAGAESDPDATLGDAMASLEILEGAADEKAAANRGRGRSGTQPFLRGNGGE